MKVAVFIQLIIKIYSPKKGDLIFFIILGVNNDEFGGNKVI